VHAPTEAESDNTKDSSCEEPERILDQLLKYHKKILLGYFNEEVRREDTSKPTIRNESLHDINNDNRVIVENFVTLKNLLRIKYSRSATFRDAPGHLLMGTHTTTLITS
jgi:hypothetical protein